MIGRRVLKMSGTAFVVEDAPDGGYTARALDASIFTEADTLDELRNAIRDAVACHYGDDAPAKSP